MLRVSPSGNLLRCRSEANAEPLHSRSADRADETASGKSPLGNTVCEPEHGRATERNGCPLPGHLGKCVPERSPHIYLHERSHAPKIPPGKAHPSFCADWTESSIRVTLPARIGLRTLPNDCADCPGCAGHRGMGSG